MPKRNREILMQQSPYDLLMKMQYELELCRQHNEGHLKWLKQEAHENG